MSSAGDGVANLEGGWDAGATVPDSTSPSATPRPICKHPHRPPFFGTRGGGRHQGTAPACKFDPSRSEGGKWAGDGISGDTTVENRGGRGWTEGGGVGG